MTANSGGGQGLRRTAAGEGGIFVGCEKSISYRTIISHCVKPQHGKLFCVGKVGQTSCYIIQ